MNILYVCTANICRSPAAEYLMRDAVRTLGLRDVHVSSAGVRAVPGMPACGDAMGARARDRSHRSRRLNPAAIEWADLILTAARDHQGPTNDLVPSVRTNLFTIRQVGRMADWMMRIGLPQAGKARAQNPGNWAARFSPEDPRRDVLPLSDAWEVWLLEELDAARGFAPIPPGTSPDDIRDPHEGDPAWHTLNYQQLWLATNSLVTLIQSVQKAASLRPMA